MNNTININKPINKIKLLIATSEILNYDKYNDKIFETQYKTIKNEIIYVIPLLELIKNIDLESNKYKCVGII